MHRNTAKDLQVVHFMRMNSAFGNGIKKVRECTRKVSRHFVVSKVPHVMGFRKSRYVVSNEMLQLEISKIA
jgi:hypothetical protein